MFVQILSIAYLKIDLAFSFCHSNFMLLILSKLRVRDRKFLSNKMLVLQCVFAKSNKFKTSKTNSLKELLFTNKLFISINFSNIVSSFLSNFLLVLVKLNEIFSFKFRLLYFHSLARISNKATFNTSVYSA